MSASSAACAPACPAARWAAARGVLFLAVCALGVSAVLTQLVLMRELMAAFSGNELVLGTALGSWMLLTGAGASLGRIARRLRRPLAALCVCQVLVALLPVASVWLLRTLRDAVFVRGAEAGPAETLAASLVVLSPYCLVTGFLLALACRVLASGEDAASIGQVYFLDVLGDVAGGLLFSFVLAWLVGHFGILYAAAFLNLFFALLVARLARSRLLAGAAACAAAGLAALALACDLDAASTRRQYAGQEVVYQGQSPYGRQVVTRLAGQITFYSSGVPLFSTGDAEAAEQAVHFAMAQRPGAARVLLISGGASGAAREVLKWGDREADRPVVDYVELDPAVLEAGRRFAPESLDDPRIRAHATDGRLLVRSGAGPYDVVIADVPDPSTSQLNRFYTREFFAEVKGRLAPDGVFSVSCGAYENYLSPELADLVAVTHRTLRERFERVLMLPAARIVFLASDGPLSAEVAQRIESHGVKTHFVRREYLEGTVTEERIAALRRAVRDDAPINRDFNPVLYFRHLRYWMSQFQVRFGMLVAAFGALGAVCAVRARPVTLAVFSAGFAASALHVVLLLGFQVLFGCVYHRVGLIVTMFMAGLAIGAGMMNRRLDRWDRRGLAWLALLLAGYAAALPAVLSGLGRAAAAPALDVALQIAVLLLALMPAVLVGMVFPLAGKAAFGGVSATAARLYTADYLGAALGAMAVSTLLIPLWGVTAVCMLAAALNVAAGAVILATRKG